MRVAVWRGFTKSFKSKSDAVSWIEETENKLRISSKPRVNVGEITLRDLLQNMDRKLFEECLYGDEVSALQHSLTTHN